MHCWKTLKACLLEGRWGVGKLMYAAYLFCAVSNIDSYRKTSW